MRSPVPDGVRTELDRVVQRWHLLPLDHALSFLPAVRALVDDLAAAPSDDLADAAHSGPRVPDLGPGVVMDQLRVLVYDACAAGSVPFTVLEERLARLRRTLV